MAAEDTKPDVANLNISMEASNEPPAAPIASIPENNGITAGV